MFKIYRSTSEILHNNRPSDRDISKHLPAEVEDRIRRKSKQLIKTEDSRQMFGQARSVAQNTPTLKRNRSASYSKPKIFSKARQVKGNETFHKTLVTQNTMNSCLGASTFQFSQYKNDRSKNKLNEVVQRKLIISKVLSDMQESKPRLTLRREILKNEEKSKQAELLQPKHKPKQDQHLLGYSQSKIPSQLVYSKQFQPKDDPYRYNESLNLISIQANQLKLKQYSQQLAANIQQSIKKQMDEHYLAKEKQLQEKYIEKEKLYLEKFKNLEVVMEAQLEKERKILIETINQQLEKQISKVNQVKEDSKRQRVEENHRSIEQSPRIEATPRTVIESKQEEVNRQTKQRKPSESKIAEVANIFNQSETVQIQEFNTTKKAETNDRKKPTHAEPSNLPPKHYDTSDNTKLSKPIKATVQPPIQQKNNRKKSNYNDDSILQEIQEITLEKKPETNMVKRQIEKDRVNQSFNIDKKLNSSFSSQRPLPNKGKTSEEPKLQRKLSEQQKIKQQQQKRKTYVRAKLKQQIQNDAILIAIGEVAGYCSKYCKKSKIDWRIPSLLLYRYCFDFFRSFKDLYEQAKELNIIKKDELDKYYDYDTVMGANLSKMYKAITKKITLSSVYTSMIESNEIQLERLKPYAIMQAKKYVKELASSAESSPKGGDYVVVQCGLRVINSVFIIKKLNEIPTQLIQENIQSLGEAQTFSLFEEWSSKLLEEQ